jgi:hypothetical protein
MVTFVALSVPIIAGYVTSACSNMITIVQCVITVASFMLALTSRSVSPSTRPIVVLCSSHLNCNRDQSMCRTIQRTPFRHVHGVSLSIFNMFCGAWIRSCSRCTWCKLASMSLQNIFTYLSPSRCFQVKWPYHIPQVIFILFYILAAVMAFAVGVMCAYHVWTVSSGETTVEAQDHEVYRKMATSRGEVRVLAHSSLEGTQSFTRSLLTRMTLDEERISSYSST